MSGVDVWGYAGNLAYTRYFTHKGVVDAVLYRTNLDYLKGYTVTGVTHGHDGHLQPREWVLGLVLSCLINLITCWDSLGCPCGIVFERDPWKRTQK